MYQPRISEPTCSKVDRYALLCERMGIKNLHRFQREAIEAIQQGMHTMVLVPTGWGKSICYIGPALLQDGLVLVISPLIALMRDQLKAAQRMGLAAAALDSLQSSQQKSDTLKDLRSGKLNLLLVSPERLSSRIFRQILASIPISLVAVDEAHCINQWGHDFRPAYRQLGDFISCLGEVPLMALTATATRQDRIQIAAALKMQNPKLVKHDLVMDHLDIRFMRVGKLSDQLTLLLQAVKNQAHESVGIIYTNSRRRVDEIARMLRNAGLDGVGTYHAGMNEYQRNIQQLHFDHGQVRIMVATKAFGMGIDKSNVRFVFHANMPDSLESYVQEIGRAGRDGKQAQAMLFYGPKDFYTQRFLIERSFPDAPMVRLAYIFLQRQLVEAKPILEKAMSRLLLALPQFQDQSADEMVSFLLRYGVLQRFTTMIASEGGAATQNQVYLAWNATQPNIDELCHIVLEQKEERMQRLRAMHRLIKNKVDPHQYISEYFE